jgi:hypothetical protein
MTDRAQFEAMLEALINEDHDAAKEIFHNIVVGKSREIYEELLAEDFSPEQANAAIGGHAKTEGMEEECMEEESMEEEGAEEEEEEESDAEEEEEEEEGDTDEFDDDSEMSDDEQTDRIMDLEDALEDLKAEFEMLLKGEEHEEHDNPGIHGVGSDDMMDMDAEMDEEGMPIMEYYKKVSVSHGDHGQYTKSAIDDMPNDMGGTTANIAQSFSTEKGGTQGGLAAPTTKPLIGDVMNSVKADAGKKAFKKQEPGHGAEKKGKGEVGGVDKKSTIGGRIR